MSPPKLDSNLYYHISAKSLAEVVILVITPYNQNVYLFKKNINFASTYLILPSRFNLKFPSSMKHSVSFLILNVNCYLWKGHTTLMMTLLLLFIHSSVDGHLGCVHSLVIMNNATVIIYVQVFIQIYILSSTDECIKQMRYIHTMGYYLAIKD